MEVPRIKFHVNPSNGRVALIHADSRTDGNEDNTRFSRLREPDALSSWPCLKMTAPFCRDFPRKLQILLFRGVYNNLALLPKALRQTTDFHFGVSWEQTWGWSRRHYRHGRCSDLSLSLTLSLCLGIISQHITYCHVSFSTISTVTAHEQCDRCVQMNNFYVF